MTIRKAGFHQPLMERGTIIAEQTHATTDKSEMAEVWHTLWDQLRRACVDRKHPYRECVLATVDGDTPKARYVILRRAEESADTLELYSDSRADKIRELRANPKATLLFWHPRWRIQARFRGEVRVFESGPEEEAAWNNLGEHGHLLYGSDPAPGTHIEQSDAWQPAAQPREYFSVLLFRVLQADWLELGSNGHRRIDFTRGDKDWIMRWMVP